MHFFYHDNLHLPFDNLVICVARSFGVQIVQIYKFTLRCLLVENDSFKFRIECGYLQILHWKVTAEEIANSIAVVWLASDKLQSLPGNGMVLANMIPMNSKTSECKYSTWVI